MGWFKIFSLLREQRSFFGTRPDIYIVFDEEHIRNLFVLDNRNYVSDFTRYVRRFNKQNASFILVLKEKSNLVLPENSYLLITENLIRFLDRLNVTEIWIDSKFVMKYSSLINYVIYNLFNTGRVLLNRKLRVVILCFDFKELCEMIEKSDVSKYFHMVYYVVDGETSLSRQVDVIKDYVLSLENLSLSLDFSLDRAFSEGLGYFFRFLREIFPFYCEVLGKGNVRISTLDYFLKGRPCQCFSGDCLNNTITFVGDGRIYLCAKSAIYGFQDTVIGNIFDPGISADMFIEFCLLNEDRLSMKKKQGRKVCDCDYWKLCHRGCNLFDFSIEDCRDFFRELRILQDRYADILNQVDKKMIRERIGRVFLDLEEKLWGSR